MPPKQKEQRQRPRKPKPEEATAPQPSRKEIEQQQAELLEVRRGPALNHMTALPRRRLNEETRMKLFDDRQMVSESPPFEMSRAC